MDNMYKAQKILTGVFLLGVLLGGIGLGIALVEYSSLDYGGECLLGEDSLVTKSLDYDFELDGRKLIITNSGFYWGDFGEKVEADSTVPAGTIRYEVTYNEKTITPYLVFEKYDEEESSETVLQEEAMQLEDRWEEEGEGVLQEQSAASDNLQSESREGDGEVWMEEGESAEAGMDGSVQKESEQIEPGDTEPEEGTASPSQQKAKESGYLGYLCLEARSHVSDFALLMENKNRILEELKQNRVFSYDVAYITDIRIKVNPETLPYIENSFGIQ